MTAHSGHTTTATSLRRTDHVGVVVDDLAATMDFLSALGVKLNGRGSVGGDWVDRIVDLNEIHVHFALGTKGKDSSVKTLARPLPDPLVELVPCSSRQPPLAAYKQEVARSSRAPPIPVKALLTRDRAYASRPGVTSPDS